MKALALAFGLAASGAASAATNDAFDRLGSALVGDWVSSPTDRGRVVRVDYRTVSKGSVLVESWQAGTTGETVSVFHRDGARVVATHYCAQGNQPRLILRESAGRAFVFDFLDATNLPDASRSHLHHLELRPLPDGRLERIETYRGHGVDETTRLHFTRVAHGGPR